MRAEDRSPACVKPEHLGFLLVKGWASPYVLPPKFACVENCATNLLYDYGYICRGIAGQNSCILNTQYFKNESLTINQASKIGQESIVIITEGAEDQSSGNTVEPQLIKVVIGVNNTVKWENHGILMQGIVADNYDDPLFSQATNEAGIEFNNNYLSSQKLENFIRSGQSFTFTFTKPGEFGYHGVPHPWINGKVIVLTSPVQLTDKNIKNATVHENITTIRTNSTTENITHGNAPPLGSNNINGTIQNQSMLNYTDCTSSVPTFLDNPPSTIYPHSVKPFPPVSAKVNITSGETGKIKIIEIGMCPTQLKIGDKPHFTLTYQNISDKSFYHQDIHPYSHLLVYTISPSDKVKEIISLGGRAVGLAQFVGIILPNQTAIDPAKGAGLLNGDIRTILFGPSGEYQITNSGMLTVTMYLGLQEDSNDLVETIQFNVNATQ
jgi:plastocyanin